MSDVLDENEAVATGDGPSKDTLFELLSDEYRRFVVAIVNETTTPVAMDTLARRIADRGPSSAATPDDPEAVRRSLYHCHVPKLAAAGVVEHDRERNAVEPGTNFEDLVELWDSAPGAEGPNPER